MKQSQEFFSIQSTPAFSLAQEGFFAQILRAAGATFALWMLLFNMCFAAPPLASASGDDEFLSIDEYQQHLWRNPRGIGCHHCHGERGESVEFAKYKGEDKRLKTVRIASIKGLSYPAFRAALVGKSGVKNIMPEYHLTEKEIQNLYDYIKKGEQND